MALVALLAVFFLPESRPERGKSIDFLSVLLCLLGLFGSIFALKQGLREGFSPLLYGILALGLGAGTIFFTRQKTLANPLLDISLLTSPQTATVWSLNVLGACIALGSFFVMTQFYQLVLHISPLNVGLWTAPAGIIMAVCSLLAPLFMKRMGAKTTLGLGFLTAACGLIIAAFGIEYKDFFMVWGGHLILSLGVGPLGAISTDLFLTAVPSQKAGMASGLSETGFELGGALGIALLGSILSITYTALLQGNTPLTGISASDYHRAGETFPSAFQTVTQLTGQGYGEQARLLLEQATTAYMTGASFALVAGSVLAVMAAILCFMMLKSPPKMS
jgi:DHA2 family multidrug resistance protein-like MFS transporter